MFRKYEKTPRILTPNINVPGKYYLSKDEVKDLLTGEVIIEEKMDGANVGIIRHKNGFHLQKRGSLVGQSEHDQFQYFHNWANVQKWEQIMSLPKGLILYGEWMRCKHHVFYDLLPDYFLAFAAFDTRHEEWLDYDTFNGICFYHGFHPVPLLFRGPASKLDLEGLIPDVSKYGHEPAEGIVIKRYRKGEMLKAKLVRPDFIKALDESDHWMHEKPTYNKLANGEPNVRGT